MTTSLQVVKIRPKAGFIGRKQIYAVYADHFEHVGRIFSATNAHLRYAELSLANNLLPLRILSLVYAT